MWFVDRILLITNRKHGKELWELIIKRWGLLESLIKGAPGSLDYNKPQSRALKVSPRYCLSVSQPCFHPWGCSFSFLLPVRLLFPTLKWKKKNNFWQFLPKLCNPVVKDADSSRLHSSILNSCSFHWPSLGQVLLPRAIRVAKRQRMDSFYEYVFSSCNHVVEDLGFGVELENCTLPTFSRDIPCIL